MPNPQHCKDLDLFGEVIITIEDVELWLDAVPHIFRDQTRQREYYAQNWNVTNKIKLSKLDGSFEKLITERTLDRRQHATVANLLGTRYA